MNKVALPTPSPTVGEANKCIHCFHCTATTGASAAELSIAAASGSTPAPAGTSGDKMVSPETVAATQPMHPLSSRFIEYPSHARYRDAAPHVRLEVMDNAQLPQVIRDSPGD